MRLRSWICLAFLVGLPTTLRAEVTTFTVKVRADFEFSLLGHTPINDGETTPFIPFRAIGELTFQLDPSINDPSHPTTVPFLNVTGHIQGVSPAPFLPYVISPDVEFLGGALTDIARDGNGDVTSALVSNWSSRWDMVGTPGNLRLFTLDGLPFDGAITALPFAYGTVLSGAADFNVYLDNGSDNPLVVIGRNRTLTVIPEPSSVLMLAIGIFGLGSYHGSTRPRSRSGGRSGAADS